MQIPVHYSPIPVGLNWFSKEMYSYLHDFHFAFVSIFFFPVT